MTSKKLGALLRSVPQATVTEDADEPVATPALAAAEPVVRKRVVPVVEPEVPLQVLVPKSIRTQLGVKAAEEGESLRALVLRAVRSLGITVTDAQIKGKRGRRSA